MNPFRSLTLLLHLAAYRNIALVTAASLVAPAFAGLPPVVNGQPLPSLAPMLEKVMPSVVNIKTLIPVQVPPPSMANNGAPFLGEMAAKEESLGSGVVVDAQSGFIVTNQHVIEDSESITVTFENGHTVTATVVGADPETDLALIKVNYAGLRGIAFSDSDQLRVGDFVVAVGNAYGLGKTVTSGIVSGMGRSGLGFDSVEDFIQTDAMVHPGNSGGALVNLRGELIGINTAILAPGGQSSGISFAIPVNMVRTVVDQLIGHGEIRRGSIGAQFQDITEELAAAYGVRGNQGAVITQIASHSAVANAGLQTGDVVIAVDGHSIRDAVDLRNRIALIRVGQMASFKVVRHQQVLDRSLMMLAPSLLTMEGESLSKAWAGALVGEKESSLGGYRGGKRVVVQGIEPGSAAMLFGLRQGDVIDTVNRRGVDTLSDLIKLVSGSGIGALNGLRVRILRNGTPLVFTLH